MALIIFWISLFTLPAWTGFEGDYFSIHYRGPDRGVVKLIDSRLSEHYFRLTNFFDVDFPEKIDVFVHPDYTSLKNTMNIESSASLLVGMAVGDREIHIVNPLNPPGNNSYESVMDGLVHEFVHLCVARAGNRNLPIWLNEGLAVYYAGQSRFAREVPGLVRGRTVLPGLASLSDKEKFAARHGYQLSYTIIEMVEQFAGQEGISRWVREYPDHSALGLSNLSELESLWHRHLETRYRNPEPLKGWVENSGGPFQVSFEPNPVKDFGELKFTLLNAENFTLDVLDPWGNKMQTLFTKRIEPGFHGFRIDARAFPPGIYYLLLSTSDQEQLVRFEH